MSSGLERRYVGEHGTGEKWLLKDVYSADADSELRRRRCNWPIEDTHCREAMEHHRGLKHPLQGELDETGGPRDSRVSGESCQGIERSVLLRGNAGPRATPAVQRATDRCQAHVPATMDLQQQPPILAYPHIHNRYFTAFLFFSYTRIYFETRRRVKIEIFQSNAVYNS